MFCRSPCGSAVETKHKANRSGVKSFGSHGAARSARRGGRRTNAGRRRQHSPRDRRRKGDLDVPLRILTAGAIVRVWGGAYLRHHADARHEGAFSFSANSASSVTRRPSRSWHKLRSAMVRPGRDRIGGKWPVEVDETWGWWQDARRGPGVCTTRRSSSGRSRFVTSRRRRAGRRSASEASTQAACACSRCRSARESW